MLYSLHAVIRFILKSMMDLKLMGNLTFNQP